MKESKRKTEEKPLELTLRSLSMTFNKVVVSVGIWGGDFGGETLIPEAVWGKEGGR